MSRHGGQRSGKGISSYTCISIFILTNRNCLTNLILIYVCLIQSSNFKSKTLKSAQVIFCSAFQTSLLQGHLNRNLRYVATLNKEHLSSFTINTVQVYGQEKYLLVSDWN